MRRILYASSVALLLAGCEERLGPERVATVPVSGTVFIGGSAAPDVRVTFHAVDAKNDGGRYTSQPFGITDKEGRFVISTYAEADGAAAGTYAVTFEWLKFNVLQNQWGGPDRLKGKYSDPAKTEHKVTVTGEEESLEVGPFVLSTK